MDEQHKIFFQTLLNNPSITPSQIKKINKLRVEESVPEEIIQSKIPNDEVSFDQPRNVTNLLSKFDKDREFGIILHPDKKDSAAFGNSIEAIQRELISVLKTISIPKTLRAFLSVFTLGKYGPYKEWVGFDGTLQHLTCSTIIKQNWCKHEHPLRFDKTKESFNTFAQAIRVDSCILNTLLDQFEEVYCQPIEENKSLSVTTSKKNQKKTSKRPTKKSTIQRSVERYNLERADFHTYTRILYSALACLLTLIAKHSSKDVKIFVGYSQDENTNSIIIRHSYLKKNSIIVPEEIDRVKKILPKILTGYAELTVEGDFRTSKRSKKHLFQRHYIVKVSENDVEELESVENGTTYHINFFK